MKEMNVIHAEAIYGLAIKLQFILFFANCYSAQNLGV